MPSNTVINEKVRNTLDNKKKVMGRTNLDSDPYKSASNNKKSYLKNISRTPYVLMTSEALIQDVSSIKNAKKRGDLEDKTAASQSELISDFKSKGPVTLSNQEFSKDRKDVTYGTKSYNARGNRNRPTAGIRNVSSEYASSGNVNFIKKATINWTCHSLEDLDILSERFLIFGARVYVEFGWVLPGSNISRGTFVDSNGKVDLQESQKSINSQLAKKVIELGEGTFEAFIGRIENFSITSREDGSFDCSTELMANGIDILNAPTDTNPDTNVELSNNPYNNTEIDLSKLAFREAVKGLPSSILKILSEEKGVRNENIFTNVPSAEGIKEYEANEYYDIDTGKKVDKKEAEKYSSGDKRRRYNQYSNDIIEFTGYEKQTKDILSNENLVVIKQSGFTSSGYRVRKETQSGQKVFTGDLRENREELETRAHYSVSTSTIEARSDSDEMIIEGYAALYDNETNIGPFKETISRGAFDEVLDNDVRALMNHDPKPKQGHASGGRVSLSAGGLAGMLGE